MKSGALVAALGLLTAISPAQSWLAWSKYSDSQPGNLGFPHYSYAPDGSLYCVASTGGGDQSASNGNCIMRFDATGTLLWKVQGYGMIVPLFAGVIWPQTGSTAVAATPTGVYSANISSRDLPTGTQLVLNRYDQNGVRIWTRFADPFPQSNSMAECSVAADSQNNVYAIAEFDNSSNSAGGTYKGRLFKFLADGTAGWVVDIGTTLGLHGTDQLQIKIDHADNVIVYPQFSNARFAKYSPNGSLLFKKVSSTPAESTSSSFGIEVGPDNSIYLGIAWYQGTVSKTNVEKYSPTGVLAWSTQIPNEDTQVYTALDSQSNIYVGNFNGSAHADLTKVSSSGAILWTKPISMSAQRITTDANDNVHVLGGGGQNSSAIVYKKFDSSGNELIAKPGSAFYSDALTHYFERVQGQIVAYHAPALNSLAVQHIDNTGTVSWSTTVTRTAGDAFTVGAATDPSGNTYMLGGVPGSAPRINVFSPTGTLVAFKPLDCRLWMPGRYHDDDQYTLNTGLGVFAMKPIIYLNNAVYVNLDGGQPHGFVGISRFERLDLSGNKVWEYQTPGDPATAFASDGSYIYGAGNYLYKLSQGGGLVWKTQLPNQVVNQVLQPSIADQMVADSNHNVYVSSRRMIYRFNSTGAVQWSYKTATSTKVDIYHDLKIAPDGNLVAAETIYPVTMEPVGQVVKISQAGATLWTAKPSIPNTSQLSIYKVAFDTSGNTYALGAVRIGGKYSAMLHKVDGSGQILWSKTLDFGSHTTPVDIKVGAAGRLIVGCNTMGAGSIDYVLARLDANGVIQHTDIYNGPYFLSDYELGFNLDSVGNSYVYGWSVGGGGNIDFHLVKYLTSNP